MVFYNLLVGRDLASELAVLNSKLHRLLIIYESILGSNKKLKRRHAKGCAPRFEGIQTANADGVTEKTARQDRATQMQNEL